MKAVHPMLRCWAAARPLRAVVLAVVFGAAAPLAPAAAADARPGLLPCRLTGVEHGALCGSVQRPLDPAQPAGTAINVHFAVLPALARNRKPDPVFFFAGGPGQSALELAGEPARIESVFVGGLKRLPIRFAAA